MAAHLERLLCSLVATLALAADARADLTSRGSTIYDSVNNVVWLADANLAFDATLRQQLGAGGLPIDTSGTMDYWTAQDWIRALDNYNNGQGYLGHNNWQLPVTPPQDCTCVIGAGNSGNSFGPGCAGSNLGALYSYGLGVTYPDSVVPNYKDSARIAPFNHLQPAAYWTAIHGASGQQAFSFLTGAQTTNTTAYNYLHALPMLPGYLGDVEPTGGTFVQYPTGSAAAGLAVYDTVHKITWPLDANLAAANNFCLSGGWSIPAGNNQQCNQALSPPALDVSGAMLASEAENPAGDLDDPHTLIGQMNLSGFAGADPAHVWMLPTPQNLIDLETDLNLSAGDHRLVNTSTSVGPFANFQPFFYWACQRDASASSQSACNGQAPGPSPNGQYAMQWSFNFDEGFQGTDEAIKRFYVLPYYVPVAPTQTIACPSLQINVATAGLDVGFATLAPTHSRTLSAGAQMKCEYAPAQLVIGRARAQDCTNNPSASAYVKPLAPWNPGAAGTTTTVALTLAGTPAWNSSTNLYDCTYVPTNGPVTFSSWSYAPNGTLCQNAPSYAFTCAM